MAAQTPSRVTIRELAELLGISRVWLGKLQMSGVLPRTAKDGTVPLAASIQHYGKHLATPTKNANRDALLVEQHRKLKLENDAKELEVVPVETVEALVAVYTSAVDAELDTWPKGPARVRQAVAREVSASRERIHKAMQSALEDLMAPALEHEDAEAA